MAPVDPEKLLYMLWATTQHYADFGHQIETLNAGRPLADAQWQAATDNIKAIILRGIGVVAGQGFQSRKSGLPGNADAR